MPLKQIPQLGDSNWGTPLNAHLAQLQNPTNGGINSFEQFSQRPTNLTADDVGKTYLYTQTGNLHQWTGTNWKVLNESVINVKDYGAIGDGVADDTLTVQALLDKCSDTNNKPLFFPDGTYAMNVVTNYFPPNFLGNGRWSTKLTSFTADGYVITISAQETWCPFEIKNLKIIGNVARTKNGIQFGQTTFINGDQFAGGLRLIQVVMTDLNIGIFKRYGAIGNNFDSCSFRLCNYHYKAIGYTGDPGDHVGCDTFYKCEFGTAAKASIYIDGNNGGVNGQTIFRDCVFQGNPGFCFYIKRCLNNQFTPGFIIENTWFEFNSVKETSPGVFVTNDPVDIDGIMSIPRQFYLNEVNVRIINSYVYEIELIRSNVLAKGTASNLINLLPATNVIKDKFSSIIFEETTSNYDFFQYSKTPIYLYNGSAASRTTITAPRQLISKSSDNLIYSDSFAERETLFFNGLTGANYGKLVKDGRLFDRCFEMTFDSTNNNQDYIMDPFIPLSPTTLPASLVN
jgi:Pectate lyase superfamily protein